MELQINKLSFGYDPSRQVLEDLQFTVHGNRTLAIVGASGSGKSSFLRILCGILPGQPSHRVNGEILIDGMSPAQFAKTGNTGFMFQQPTLLPNLTVRQNIAFPLKLRGEKKDAQVQQLIEMVGLTAYADDLPSSLSEGMKTRVSLARIFAVRPSLILLDEPFSNLDLRWKYCLYRELETLRALYEPMIILVTHDLQEALLLSNDIIVFGRNGRIIENMVVDKPLPRVFEGPGIFALEEEQAKIQSLILNN